MDTKNLIPSLAYEDTPEPPKEGMMNLGMKEIVEMALNKDMNVLKEAAAEADKLRQEAEKEATERGKKPGRTSIEKERDRELNLHDTAAANILADATQKIYDVERGVIENRAGSRDASHIRMETKYLPGAKRMNFFTDEDGVRRAAWTTQLTNEEGADLERNEISNLLKNATTEEDKEYYTKVLTIIDEEKKAGRTPVDKKYDAGWLAGLFGATRSRLSDGDRYKTNDLKRQARNAIQNNLENGPAIRAKIEEKYGAEIERIKKMIAENAKTAPKKTATKKK